MEKNPKLTDEEAAALKARILSEDWERKMLERIAYHEAKLEEERRLGLR
jgi:hypothetical protein